MISVLGDNETHDVLITAAGAIVVAILGLAGVIWQGRKTRGIGTAEHVAASADRAESEGRLGSTIEELHKDVRQIYTLLVGHIQDPHAHRGGEHGEEQGVPGEGPDAGRQGELQGGRQDGVGEAVGGEVRQATEGLLTSPLAHTST